MEFGLINRFSFVETKCWDYKENNFDGGGEFGVAITLADVSYWGVGLSGFSGLIAPC